MKFRLILLSLLIFVNLAAASSQELYWQAKSSPADFQELYQKAYQKDPESLYAQKSLLELGKLQLLNRNYETALQYLKKVTNASLQDKEFWLAKTYFKLKKYDNAIISSQNFISDAKDNQSKYSEIETAYFLLVESYLQKDLYSKALRNLEYLRKSKYIQNNLPLLRYKIGLCHEKMKDYEQALKDYKKLKRDFPYHQYSYLAEERMMQMSRDKVVDIELDSFSTLANGKQPSKAATGEGLKVYLQIGAFSSTKRAEVQGKKAMNLGLDFSIFPKKVSGKTLYIVAVGPFQNGTLNSAIKKLNDAGINSFVIKRYE